MKVNCAWLSCHSESQVFYVSGETVNPNLNRLGFNWVLIVVVVIGLEFYKLFNLESASDSCEILTFITFLGGEIASDDKCVVPKGYLPAFVLSWVILPRICPQLHVVR